jgi:hypothetical protein
MFSVTEAEAAAIRAAFERGGEFAAAVELRRLFPGRHGQRRGAGVRAHHRQLEAGATTGAADQARSADGGRPGAVGASASVALPASTDIP